MDINFEGLDKLTSQLKELPKILQIESNKFNSDIANEILEEAKRLCPVKSGHLKDSGYVRFDGKGFTVGFGAEYAIYVHENMSAKHTIGQAKFLQTALVNVKRRHNLK